MRRVAPLLASALLWAGPFIRESRSEELTGQEPFDLRARMTLNSDRSSVIQGPLFSCEANGAEKGWTLAPLLSYRADSVADYAEFDLLYPLLTYDRFGKESRFQVLQLFSIAGAETTESESRNRVTLFPLFFHRRSSNPASNYLAILPFYGHLENRLFRDEVRFVMFPLYLQTRKRDVVTDNYLAPFFHLRRGEALRGWQFWPLAGYEQKSPTSMTNLLGETEVVPGHEKTFALWPFYFNEKLGLGTDHPQTQRVLLPFYSLERSPLRDSSTFLWPFGLTYTDDRAKKYREWGAPWPLVTFARGEGKTANRIWPLFGRSSNSTLQSDFYLWPLYKHNRATSEPLDRERTRIFFFLYSDLIERNTATGTALHRTDLWPLFTARRDHTGNQSLHLLSLLEPFLPNSKSIERNYSPAWLVWHSEKDGQTGATRQSLLWNLYRRETTATTKNCSLLFGLFRYQSTPQGKRWRVFCLPVGKTSKAAPAPPHP